MIERITANHFKFENKMYYAPISAIDRYEKTQGIRNLMSRARLLDDTEASSVSPSFAYVLVVAYGGDIHARVVTSVDAELRKLKVAYNHAITLFQSKKVYKKAAENLIKEVPISDIPKHLPHKYLIEDYAEVISNS